MTTEEKMKTAPLPKGIPMDTLVRLRSDIEQVLANWPDDAAKADAIAALFATEMENVKEKLAESDELAAANIELEADILKCRKRRNELKSELEKKDAEIAELRAAFKRLYDDLITAEAYGFNRYLDREDLKDVLLKKDTEIADLKFTAFKRLQDIQGLEQRIAGMTERADVRTEVIAEAGKAITALQQRIAELEGKGNIQLDKRTAK